MFTDAQQTAFALESIVCVLGREHEEKSLDEPTVAFTDHEREGLLMAARLLASRVVAEIGDRQVSTAAT